jgi:hypothetical protein
MGWRGTLLLAAALAGALAWLGLELAADRTPLTFASLVGGERELPPGERITHLLSFDPATVTAIRIRRGGQEFLTERRDGAWTGTERSAAVDDFLASLLELAEVMPLEVSADELASHGLAPPEAVVELTRRGAPPIVLYLGRHNPPATAVYAQLGPHGRVVLTGALATWELEKAIRALSPTAAAS